MEVATHGQSTENEKLVAFLQYIKKKLSQLLLCSIVMQNIQIFSGGPVIFVVTSCFLKKLYMRWGQVVCSLVSNILVVVNFVNSKSKLYKTLDYWSRNMLNFDFSEMGLGMFSPEKCFSCYILLTEFHWLITFTSYIAIVCFPGCDVINFEIKLKFWIFEISCFSTWPKIQGKYFNILRTKRTFKMK